MTTAADGEFLLASDVPETAAGQLLKISVKHPEYLPFGEELSAGTGGRTSNQGYSGADNVRQKFTGYERDGETGLDYAQARYYASTQGRFTSVDPQNAGADPEDPQSWNGYSYTGNNPLRRVDPTGMFWEELKNALKGRGWINNADFQKKVEEARKDITENFGIVRDGKYVPFDLNGLNDDQIIGLQTYLHQQSAAGNTINQGDAKPQGDALTPSSVGITVPGGSGPSTVGQGLKNVRDISSGRLKGYSRGNTEMPGGAQAAKDTFRQLTGRDPAGTFDRVVQGGKEVVYRASSKSGPSKVEVVDHAQKFVEKISFK
ncbi:MAG: RHS repeat-associated core domain-containing protein [Pyrinomonadaceae bacterium]|nr:RHS repeat-associated core domain-containing protein [Pyrinomonadaceae bacterium]